VEDFEPQFKSIIKRIQKFKEIKTDTKIFEVGSGSGWFSILCQQNGISCEGLEISPQLVRYAQKLARRYGIELNIKLGNIEIADVGISRYDIIIALSTFEHVEHWQIGIKRIYDALKPGGLFYLYSTNKFSLFSGEYKFPFYSWLPDKWRYHIRISRTGKDIMKLGIDFNQFNYFQLRRFFRAVGFSLIFDQFEIIDQDSLINSTIFKKTLLRLIKRFESIKSLALTFLPGTLFICIK
jgi:SAM-dependent methyltransferase